MDGEIGEGEGVVHLVGLHLARGGGGGGGRDMGSRVLRRWFRRGLVHRALLFVVLLLELLSSESNEFTLFLFFGPRALETL